MSAARRLGTLRAHLPSPPSSHGPAAQEVIDVVVVGAGFAGMYALRKFRDRLGLRVKVLEQAGGVGGTWYWNAYPGAYCDVPVMEYQYSDSIDEDLHREYAPKWTRMMGSQPEIEKYLNYVKDRFDLGKDIVFNTKVVGCTFDSVAATWTVRAHTGARYTARFLVAAVGCLSEPNVPDIEGIDTFAGEKYFTSKFPKGGVDFAGKRVAVIGTGSSGIQSIPVIAETARQLTVFQRTPQWTLPAANREIPDRLRARIVDNYPEIRAFNRTSAGGYGGTLALRRTQSERMSNSAVPASGKGGASADPRPRILDLTPDQRRARFEKEGLQMLFGFSDTMTDMEANAVVCDLFAEHIRRTVKDPDTADKLTPRNQPFGCKRQAIDTNYYATYNRENVHLVDLRRGGIEGITPRGIKTAQGQFEFDMLVFATGFDAMTGPLTSMNIVGADGAQLSDAWSAGPRTYLGLQIAGFPNLFTVTGPGSPSVLSSVVVSIEQHVDFIAAAIEHMRREGRRTMQAAPEAQDEWVAHVNKLGDGDIVKTHATCNSWYLGANIPGKPRVFMPYVGGVGRYRRECDEIVKNGYTGFVFDQ